MRRQNEKKKFTLTLLNTDNLLPVEYMQQVPKHHHILHNFRYWNAATKWENLSRDRMRNLKMPNHGILPPPEQSMSVYHHWPGTGCMQIKTYVRLPDKYGKVPDLCRNGPCKKMEIFGVNALRLAFPDSSCSLQVSPLLFLYSKSKFNWDLCRHRVIIIIIISHLKIELSKSI